MKLTFSPGSPFARKVRIAAIELGLHRWRTRRREMHGTETRGGRPMVVRLLLRHDRPGHGQGHDAADRQRGTYPLAQAHALLQIP